MAGFLGQPKDTLADDVALDLIGAAVDRWCLGIQRHVDDGWIGHRCGRSQHAVGADDPEADVAKLAMMFTVPQLANVGFTAGALVLDPGALHVQPVDLQHGVELHEVLAHDRFFGMSEFSSHFDITVKQFHAHTRSMTFGPALLRRPDDVAGDATKRVHPLARSRHGNTGGAGADRRAFDSQGGVGNPPAIAHVTNTVVVTHDGIVHEHFAKEGASGHFFERAHIDTVLVHVDREVGHAAVFWCGRVSTSDEHAQVSSVAL